MANRNLNENINQAIADFKSIKQAIADKGVDIPTGTPTSEYGAKIGEIQTGGGSEVTVGFVPTGINTNGYPIKGILKGMTTVPSYYFHCNSTSTSTYSYFNYLQDISYEKSVTSIGTYAFHNCTSLALKTLPNSISSIASYAFVNCKKIALTHIPSGITQIENGIFQNCSGIRTLVLHEGITTIGNSVFWQCTAMTSISLPNSITKIGTQAFYSCIGITSLSIGSAITSIATNAFQGCTKLTSITINKPEGSVSGAPWGATKATVTWTG